jgi:transcriptional regulator with XRE-family HTH domain
MSTLTDEGPGAIVRRRREELRLTREKMAVECDVSVATLVRLENYGQLPGRTGPNGDLLARIAKRLDLDPDQLDGHS